MQAANAVQLSHMIDRKTSVYRSMQHTNESAAQVEVTQKSILMLQGTAPFVGKGPRCVQR
eukprot:6172811-Pleurochrysis_carterae.AAC.1